MAADDWAIIVGIWEYPGIVNLEGPQIDIKLFHKWLCSPKGGNLPRKHIISMRSSTKVKPLPHTRPNIVDYRGLFDQLDIIAKHNAKTYHRRYVGRRLYFFFAGHGVGLTPLATAVLAANADADRLGNHIVPQLYRDLLGRAAYFDEIVVFLDCCNTRVAATVVPEPPHFTLFDSPEAANVKYFTGVAAEWNRESVEREFEFGQTMGVFTYVLLKALDEAANEFGEVTGSTLKQYLEDNTIRFLSTSDRNSAQIAKKPIINVAGPSDIIFATGRTPGYLVKLKLNNGDAFVSIKNGVHNEIFAGTIISGREFRLKRGLYTIEILDGQNTRSSTHAKVEGSMVINV